MLLFGSCWLKGANAGFWDITEDKLLCPESKSHISYSQPFIIPIISTACTIQPPHSFSWYQYVDAEGVSSPQRAAAKNAGRVAKKHTLDISATMQSGKMLLGILLH